MYEQFEALGIRVEDGIAHLTIPPTVADPALRAGLHAELGQVWQVLDRDDEVRSAVITGTGDEFYASGDPLSPVTAALAERDVAKTWNVMRRMQREVTDINDGIVRFGKPLVSAINGRASAGGLGVALLADISVAAEDVVLLDPHTLLLGLAAGDHAALVWPLLCGLARTKLYVLTADPLSGAEAERIGLVSRAVPRGDVVKVAVDYAARLALAPVAVQYTKKALNQWLRLAGVVSSDLSFALEALSMFSPEVGEAYARATQGVGAAADAPDVVD